jgi:hypothetical protein
MRTLHSTAYAAVGIEHASVSPRHRGTHEPVARARASTGWRAVCRAPSLAPCACAGTEHTATPAHGQDAAANDFGSHAEAGHKRHPRTSRAQARAFTPSIRAVNWLRIAPGRTCRLEASSLARARARARPQRATLCERVGRVLGPLWCAGPGGDEVLGQKVSLRLIRSACCSDLLPGCDKKKSVNLKAFSISETAISWPSVGFSCPQVSSPAIYLYCMWIKRSGFEYIRIW